MAGVAEAGTKVQIGIAVRIPRARSKRRPNMKKSTIIELLSDQPEEVDIDRFLYTLWFRQKIDHALREANEDEGISHEEVMQEFNEWLKRGEDHLASLGKD